MEAHPSRVGVFTIANRGNKFWIAGLGTAWRSRIGSCGLRGWGISSSCWWAAPDTLACRLGSWGFSLSVQDLLQGEIGSAAYIVASQMEECNYGSLESTTADRFFLFFPPVRKKWLIAIIYWCHIWLSLPCSSDPSATHLLTTHVNLLLYFYIASCWYLQDTVVGGGYEKMNEILFLPFRHSQSI